MREDFEDYLFYAKHVLVCDGEAKCAPEVFASLAQLFGLHVSEGAELLSPSVFAVCERNIALSAPKPFYEGFPESVLKLATGDLILNQLLHYLSTYGFGDFLEPGHATLEEHVERVALRARGRVIRLRAVTADTAREMLLEEARLLLASTRPLSETQIEVLSGVIEEYDLGEFSCASRDTAARLVCHTWDERLYRLLGLPDVLRVVEWYGWEYECFRDLRHLRLDAKERKKVCNLLDHLFEHGARDARACLERRRLWRGLLHHLHYKPKSEAAQAFVDMVFSHDERSATAAFEALVASGDVVGAARQLARDKGPTAVARNLNYLISRTTDYAEADEVISLIAGTGKVVLVQLALMYAHYNLSADAARMFRFTHLDLERVHRETEIEVAHRRSRLTPELCGRAQAGVLAHLKAACANTLGRVYVDPAMERIALPLRSTVAQGGLGALPSGSRVPMEGLGKDGCVRAFCWWKGVDDIDLSCFGIGDGVVHEFSWRTMAYEQEGLEAIVYSGDETSGFKGGSEYFDISLPGMRAQYPDARYVVVCANVYSGTPFSSCTCRAGYMLREHPESGEVYEPSTVASALAVTCASTFAQLFALDLERGELVWLNIARQGAWRVAGSADLTYLLDVLDMCDTINLASFAQMLATEVVDTPEEADVIVSDEVHVPRPGQEQIRSIDTARVMALIEA